MMLQEVLTPGTEPQGAVGGLFELACGQGRAGAG